MADEQRAVRRSTGKGTTFEEREDQEFLLFFFSLSTIQERDFLKRGGSYIWLLSVPFFSCRDGSKRFQPLLSFFILSFECNWWERRSASISSSKRFLLREDIIAAILRPRWVERSGLFLLLQSRKEKERNESSLSSAKGKEESWFWAKTRRRRKGFLPPQRREKCSYFTNTIFQTLSLSLIYNTIQK